MVKTSMHWAQKELQPYDDVQASNISKDKTLTTIIWCNDENKFITSHEKDGINGLQKKFKKTYKNIY